MLITGFTDEVSDDLSLQIKALKELGWKYIELRTVDGKNVSSLTDQEFDLVYQQLTENDIEISCFGSTIANWGRDAVDSFSLDIMEMKSSIRHMKKAGVPFIRIMSYKLDNSLSVDSGHEKIIIENIKKIVRLAEDHGIVCLHENCETWGGQSYHHSLRLLEEVDSPALKLVFDTGNPVSMAHVEGDAPYSYQNSLQFFQQVREQVKYLHIKDARWLDGSLHYTYPGKGDGNITEILKLVKQYNMDIPISIEPHVAVVFHDPTVIRTVEERWDTFIQYGKEFLEMAAQADLFFDT